MITFPPQYNNPSAIFVEPEFLNNEGVDRFLSLIKNIPYEQASIFTGEDNDNHRDSKVKWIPHKDPFLDLYYMCADFINNLNSFNWKFDITNSKENFPYKKVPKKKGSAILLPSFTPHKVTPVTGGIRKSLVWWVGGIPLK
jgi:predicted 2-oxoglutarate/Fe(II)-dependent dioxygenase YbiX